MHDDATRMRDAPPAETARIKRLRFRAWRRGFREVDQVLGRFADLHAAALGDEDLSRFEALLEAPDDLVYAWILGREPPPAPHDHALLVRLREFAQSLSDLGLEPGS